MGFKTITIKDSVYKELIGAKEKKESFSDFLAKLVREKKKHPDLRRFYGAWKMSDAEWKTIEKTIKNGRKLADDNRRKRLEKMFE